MPRPASAYARVGLVQAPAAGTGGYVGVQMDGDDALVRRIVDASAMPALLAREGRTPPPEACDAQGAALFIHLRGEQIQLLAWAGCDADSARLLAVAALRNA